MFADMINRGAKFSVAKVPVGNAVALLLGVGVSGGVNEIVKGFLPAGKTREYGGIGTAFGLAWLFQNIGFFRRALGDSGVDALSIGALYHAIESAFFVQARVTGAISRLAPARAVATAGATRTAAPTQAETAAPQEEFVSSVGEKLRATLRVA